MSKIEWTEKTWSPVTGCDKVSRGCEHCYAMHMSHRLSGIAASKKKYEGTTRKTAGGQVQWTGQIKLHHDQLSIPLKWKKPRMIFVESMGDLFHEKVPFSFIDLVFAVMAICKHHTFQVLTKRIERVVEYFNYKDTSWANKGMHGDERIRYQAWHSFGKKIAFEDWKWPLPNVWIGTSVEDQEQANKRIHHLLKVPAAIRFLSCEPLIGPLDLESFLPSRRDAEGRGVDWIIAGGESGHDAQPVHPDWIRSLRDQCQAAGVPFFFKQWGAYRPFEETGQPPFYRDAATGKEFDGHGMNFIDPETAEPGKFMGFRWMDFTDTLCYHSEHDLKVRDMPSYLKVPKHKNGNLLDGKKHEEFPQSLSPESGETQRGHKSTHQ